MPDYQQMYKILFTAMTECIEILQNAQLKTEELYISSESNIKMFNPNKNNDGDKS